MLGFVVLVGLSCQLAPQLTRREIFFGVTLGTFYVNRGDPALFVEKRRGLGYTLDLGNPLSWLVMLIGIVALSIPLLLVP